MIECIETVDGFGTGFIPSFLSESVADVDEKTD
jgi:hypothetical protein